MAKDKKPLKPSERLKEWKRLSDAGEFDKPQPFWQEIRTDVELGGKPIADQPDPDDKPDTPEKAPPSPKKKGGPKPR